jgi:hypothetical protein
MTYNEKSIAGLFAKSFFTYLTGMMVVTSLTLAQQTGSPVVTKPTGTLTYSLAYIDASVESGSDVCAQIHNALAQLSNSAYKNGGGIVDARGASVSTACSSVAGSPSWGNPWSGISVPSTVLLPAGKIQINTQWVLPSGTHLIGEGGEDPGFSPNVQRTTIHAQTGAESVIQMGVNTGCTDVSIEDLVVDGNGISDLNGITNSLCLNGSFVRNVTLYQITDVGLSIGADDPSGTTLSHSGPYSNITFDTASKGTSQSTYGVYLDAPARGVRGVTCTNSNTNSSGNWNSMSGTCVNISISGNLVQDVRVEGFAVGVDVAASDAVVMNIDGDTNPNTSSSPLDVVKIESGVTNVALMSITNNCINPSGNPDYCSDSSDYTVWDNSAGSTSVIPSLSFSNDPLVAMYVVGDSITVASQKAYSRYTTSPRAANWSVGSTSISGSCSTPGSLYSNTASSSSSQALYVCSSVNSVGWVAIK